MNSYFGRFRYNYKEKYMLEATIRRDGSSVFGGRRALGYLPVCSWAGFSRTKLS
ncbi:MAG: hypothetical protein V8R91_16305 [Butyricimonas faecihominis]